MTAATVNGQPGPHPRLERPVRASTKRFSTGLPLTSEWHTNPKRQRGPLAGALRLVSHPILNTNHAENRLVLAGIDIAKVGHETGSVLLRRHASASKILIRPRPTTTRLRPGATRRHDFECLLRSRGWDKLAMREHRRRFGPLCQHRLGDSVPQTDNRQLTADVLHVHGRQQGAFLVARRAGASRWAGCAA